MLEIALKKLDKMIDNGEIRLRNSEDREIKIFYNGKEFGTFLYFDTEYYEECEEWIFGKTTNELGENLYNFLCELIGEHQNQEEIDKEYIKEINNWLDSL